MFLDWVLLEPAKILSPFRTQSIFTSTIFFSSSDVASRVATFPLCGEPAEKAKSFSVPFFLRLAVVQTLVNSSYSVSLRLAGFERVFPSCFIFYKTASSKTSSSSSGTTSSFSPAAKFPLSISAWNSFNATRTLGLETELYFILFFSYPLKLFQGYYNLRVAQYLHRVRRQGTWIFGRTLVT